MNPCRYKYAFLRFRFFAVRIALFRSDCDILAAVACQSPAKCASIDEILAKAIALYSRQIVAQVRVCVGEAVGEVDLVAILGERVRESQCKVAPAPPIAFAFESVGVVADVLANSVPRELFGPVTTQLRETEDSHALIIKRVGLGKVQDIELNRQVLPRVAHSEEEPLRVTIRINIILKH